MRGAGEWAEGGHRQVDRVSDVNRDGLFCVHCCFKMSFLFFHWYFRGLLRETYHQFSQIEFLNKWRHISLSSL